MNYVNKIFSNYISLVYCDEEYSVVSISNFSLIESIFTMFKWRPSVTTDDFKITLTISDGILSLSKIETKLDVDIKEIFGSSYYLDNGKRVFDDINLTLDDIEIVFAKEAYNYNFSNNPFHYPFEFKVVLYFSQGCITDVSFVLKELFEVDLSFFSDTGSVHLAKNEYNNILRKHYLVFEFDKILYFEDYYAFMRENSEFINEIHKI